MTQKEFDDFKLYLGTFVNYCWMKNLLKDQKSLQKIKSMHQLMYSYSHKKFYNFLKTKPIQWIILRLCEKVSPETMIENNTSLAANKQSYASHIQSLIDIVSSN